MLRMTYTLVCNVVSGAACTRRQPIFLRSADPPSLGTSRKTTGYELRRRRQRLSRMHTCCQRPSSKLILFSLFSLTAPSPGKRAGHAQLPSSVGRRVLWPSCRHRCSKDEDASVKCPSLICRSLQSPSHLFYTLPPTLLLLLLHWPLRTRWDTYKTAVLVAIAVLVTTPWDAWIIAQGAWDYPAGSVLGTTFGIPWEELAFFIIRESFVAN